MTHGQPRSACGALLFDRVDESVVVVVLALLLFDIVEVSLLVEGVVLCALGVLLWLLVSVLEPDVWAIATPPASAAAAASVVRVFLVAFMSVLLCRVPDAGHVTVGRKTPAVASWFSD